MQRHQDIIFDVTGQTLHWDCPEGRPSSITSVSVFAMETGDDQTAETATTGDPSIDSVNTTVASASGAGQSDARVLNLTSGTGVNQGQPYLVTAAAGRKEWIEPVAVAGNVATARHPLHNAYAAADTFEGVRISASLADAWVQDEANLSDGLDPTPGWRIRWEYVVDGITYVHDSYFDLVRYLGEDSLLPTDVEDMYPDFRDRLPTHHRVDEGRRMIKRAHEQVRFELLANDIDDASVRDVDALNEAVLLRFGILLARAQVQAGADPAELEAATKDYDDFMNKLIRVTMRLRQSADTTGAGTKRPARGILER